MKKSKITEGLFCDYYESWLGMFSLSSIYGVVFEGSTQKCFFFAFFLESGQIDTDIDVELDDYEKNVVLFALGSTLTQILVTIWT